MRDEVVRLRDELRAEEARTQSLQISSAAAVLSCSRASAARTEAEGRVGELERALLSILCAAETVACTDMADLGEIKNVLAGVAVTAGVALRFYDPPPETPGRDT